MHRNALSATEFFKIPPGRVVELEGRLKSDSVIAVEAGR